MNKRIAMTMTMTIAAAGCVDDTNAPIDTEPVPDTITLTGVASEIKVEGTTPVAGAIVEAHRETEAIAMATATTDAAGAYALTLDTDGVAIDGYLLAKADGYKDTYLYPAGPFSADARASMLLLTDSTFDLAGTLAQVAQEPAKGWIGVMAVDADGNPVAGVTIKTTPAGTVRYGAGGYPSATATVTDADGRAYVFNVPAGKVTIGAMKAGMKFQAHAVTARAGQVTTTLIQ